MNHELEVAERFDPRESAGALLYSQEELEGEVESTRLYRLKTDASRPELEAFARDVLVDEVSQVWELRPAREGSLRDGYRHRLDVGLKPGVLDLEREYLLAFLEDYPDPRLDLAGLAIVRRHYLFAPDGGSGLLGAARRDLVNPVIHRWRVHPDDHDG